MTTCSSRFIQWPLGLRRTIALAITVAATGFFTTNADAQTNAASGNNQGAAGNASAGEAGSTLTSQNVFSSTSDTVGDIGNNDGRFTTSRLANQPTAGGNTNTAQQNAINNVRNLQRLNQQFGRTNQNRNRGNTQGTRTIRPSLRLGFTPKPRPAEDLRKSLDKQLNALSSRLPKITDGRSEFASVKFDLARSGAVVISGSVPDDDAARLLGNILRMEPGVYSVQNDLTIASAK
tara:strand:+ start:106438 stop:107139 length:702 start_codon:yes stop_codon:yes gene_type:complete